jgi:hypothetical protein
VATELGSVSAFFRFAKSAGWIAVDPVPRWGRNQRNTLMPNIRRKRSPKFLSARQTRPNDSARGCASDQVEVVA